MMGCLPHLYEELFEKCLVSNSKTEKKCFRSPKGIWEMYDVCVCPPGGGQTSDVGIYYMSPTCLAAKLGPVP